MKSTYTHTQRHTHSHEECSGPERGVKKKRLLHHTHTHTHTHKQRNKGGIGLSFYYCLLPFLSLFFILSCFFSSVRYRACTHTHTHTHIHTFTYSHTRTQSHTHFLLDLPHDHPDIGFSEAKSTECLRYTHQAPHYLLEVCECVCVCVCGWVGERM